MRAIHAKLQRYLRYNRHAVKERVARASAFSERIYPFNGWFLSSKHLVDSQDLRRHLDWLFDQIASRKAEIDSLREAGCTFTISCYWLSREGQGGPTLSLPQVEKLAEFRFEVWFDIHFLGGPEAENEARNSLSDEAP